MKTRRVLSLLSLLILLLAMMPLATLPPAAAQGSNPWETAVGQACFERWIALAMSRLNAYKGDQNFEDSKPFSINQYGILEWRYRHSSGAPDNFRDYNYNKYWAMWDWWGPTGWDCVDKDGSWHSGFPCENFGKANVPMLRDYVQSCIAEAGGPPGGSGTPGAGGAPGGSGTPGTGGGQTGGSGSERCLINSGSGIVIQAIDNDPENKLWDCDTRRVPFEDKSQDTCRCFTFRYTVPPGGITSAALHVALLPGGMLQDTDCLVLAIGQATDCGIPGKMPGCVNLHGGFRGDEQCMHLDLLDAGCDPSVKISPEVQQAVTAQLQTGVLHFLLQDDTGVDGAQLVLNGGPRTFPCGVTSTASSGTTGSTGGATNTVLPTPPYGTPEPNPNVPGMTLQAGQRRVPAGSTVLVPVWLIKGDNVANLNFDVRYDANVAKPEGTIQQGNLLGQALFQANANESGIIRVGFAQTTGVFGTGTVALIPFRAVGQPGDRTPLTLAVTTINNPAGAVPAIDRIHGEIVIVGPDGLVPGDCDGDGRLTLADAMCALEISVKLRPPIQALDLDSSGDVTSRDAALIMQRVLGDIAR
ncbi:MAG: hypothetical protein KKA73_08715 [Chloroflexi bacterium]|nr:hypothetical protein [Chloroflexota bacterium]MBU1747759.1 hypothetical protein [Chloroflexota bacterium]